MYVYEGAFDDTEVLEWPERQITRYRKWGFDLWGVVLKETGELIGQCGLTIQPWKEQEVLEIGYLFQRQFWHQGYAIEAAKACKNTPSTSCTPTKFALLFETQIPPPSV